MAVAVSPLRYPGGKAFLYPLVSSVLRANALTRRHYAEPFAGGCGLALKLLYGGHVSDVHINDLDRGIWAFWSSVLHHTSELTDLIMRTPITVDEWDRQRVIYFENSERDTVELGFSTLFLNRTNRSGIIGSGGIIGGRDQTGQYTIGCRFNRDEMRRRVERIAKYRSCIHLSRLDGTEFVSRVSSSLPRKSFLFVDPPYVVGSKRLYRNLMSDSDHIQLAESLCSSDNRWVATYDNATSIRRMYADRKQWKVDVRYSLRIKRVETEILITCKGLRVPRSLPIDQVNRPKRVGSRADAFLGAFRNDRRKRRPKAEPSWADRTA